MLLDGLPDEAALSLPRGERWDGWDIRTELLAQIVEVASVSAAGKELSATREIPRPDRLTAVPVRPPAEVPGDEWSASTDRMFAAFAMRVAGGTGG